MTDNLFPSIGTVANQAEDSIPKSDNEEEYDHPTEEVESLCTKCGEQGITRLLLTSIPFFREVVLISFRCEHCGNENNEVQSAGTIRPEGTIYTARILTRSDMNRQLIRSSSCTISIPEYALTLPPTRGQLTTVEGLVREIIADLSADQPLRRVLDPETSEKIEALLERLRAILGEEDDSEAGRGAEHDKPMPAFTVTLDDPAGNSFIEFVGGMADPKWNMRTYQRTKEDNIKLGLVLPDDDAQDEAEGWDADMQDKEKDVRVDEEVHVFPGVCPSCGQPLDTLMKKVSIPYFKDILIMSTNCDGCGYRDNEVKSGSAISPMGKRIILKVKDREDLSRDILKSDTAGLLVPDIELELQPGTLGGRFTTVEGILEQVYEELSEKVFVGDSSVTDAEGRVVFEGFLERLKAIKSASVPFTLILDDPLANSHIQSFYAPDPDPAITVETYERTWTQDEELGLNDIKVEGYEVPEGSQEKRVATQANSNALDNRLALVQA